MKIGVYGDVHLNKNMRSLQYLWDTTSKKSLHSMYNKFDELDVELAVCLGDFLDVPRLEAKDMSLVLPILDDINSRSYPTYLLLGNHEMYDQDSNILEYLSIYENIHPVTNVCIIEDMFFIPYGEDPQLFDIPTDKIIFTHHDIYGSELASGKTKAFFGIDPDIFKDARLVMNGHVHLKSKVRKNVVNAGSILVSQQGELKVGDYPAYYVVDTSTGYYEVLYNTHSMIYLTIDEKDKSEVLRYDQGNLVLRVEYEDEIPEDFMYTAHTSWRKKMKSIEDNVSDKVEHKVFDMKNYLVEYINKDEEVSDSDKSNYIDTGVSLL